MPSVAARSSSPPRPPTARSTASSAAQSVARWWPWIGTVLRVGLGVVSLVAGLTKLSDLPASVRAVRAYQLLPDAVAQAAGNGLPILEVILGAFLIAGFLTRWSALVFGLMLVGFAIGIASAWARGLAIDCGCFGGGGPTDPATTNYLGHLLRNAGMITAAALLVARPRTRLSVDSALDPEPVTRKEED